VSSRTRASLKLTLLGVAALAAQPHAQSADSTQASADSAATVAGAQPATQDDVLGVQRDLENYKFQNQRTYDLNTAKTLRPLQFSGSFQERISWNEARQAPATNWHKHTEISVPSALLAFTGSLYKDYEEGKNLDFAVRFNASPVGDGTDYLGLLDAQVSYNFFRNLALEDDQLIGILGQQQLPFGLEPQTSDEFKPTILPAQWVGKLGLGARQIGFVLKGDFLPSFLQQVDYGYNYRAPVLQYALGVFNGTGPNIADNNDAKDVLGRVVLTLPSDYNSILRQLAFGGTISRQWFNLAAAVPGSAPTNIRVQDSTGKYQTVTLVPAGAASTKTVDLGDRTRYGFDVYYNHHPFGLNYELAYSLEDTLKTGTNVATFNSGKAIRGERKSLGQTATLFFNWGEQFLKGYRAQGRYDDWWPKSVQPFVRWDRWENDVDVADHYIDIYTGGVNVFFASTTKLQFNYSLQNDIAKKDSDPGHQYLSSFLAQVQYGF
jgi:hypothetical protein